MNKRKTKEIRKVAELVARDAGITLKRAHKLCKKQYLKGN